MFYVYILQSEKDGKLYLGYTRDLKRRLDEHRKGLGVATKHRRPLQLVYYEAYRAEHDARTRERKLKQFKNGYSRLKQRIAKSLDQGDGEK